MEIASINRRFETVGELTKWLEDRSSEAENIEEFYNWLDEYFNEGNTITVQGEEYDYWACYELTL